MTYPLAYRRQVCIGAQPSRGLQMRRTASECVTTRVWVLQRTKARRSNGSSWQPTKTFPLDSTTLATATSVGTSFNQSRVHTTVHDNPHCQYQHHNQHCRPLLQHLLRLFRLRPIQLPLPQCHQQRHKHHYQHCHQLRMQSQVRAPLSSLYMYSCLPCLHTLHRSVLLS